MDQSELQSLILRAIAEDRIDKRLGRAEYYLFPSVRALCSPRGQPSPNDVQEAVWGLVSRGLAFIDMSQTAPENWSVELTKPGFAAARDEEIHPDDPMYFSRLKSAVPALSTLVSRYVEEAVQSYHCRCYLASTVMLGVAAEAAFLELSPAFAKWLKGSAGENLIQVLMDRRSNYIQKFAEFRKRLDPEKPKLPNDLADGLNLQMDSVLDLLRVARNDAGHPKDATVGKDDCLVRLLMFPPLVKRMYQLKDFFEPRKRKRR